MRLKKVLDYEENSLPREKRELTKFFEVCAGFLLVCGIIAFVVWIALDLYFTVVTLTQWVPIIVLCGICFIVGIAFIIKFVKVKAKLSIYLAEKLASDFYPKDYLEAKQSLIEQKVITENGFVNTRYDRTDNSVIPFEKVEIIFSAAIICGVLLIEAAVRFDGVSTNSVIDNAFYNFLINNPDLITNKKSFDLFCTDKLKFAKLLVRYNNIAKIEQKL